MTHGELAGARVRGIDQIRGFALLSTSVPEYAAYNTAVVAIGGPVDMASRTIAVTGRSRTARI